MIVTQWDSLSQLIHHASCFKVPYASQCVKHLRQGFFKTLLDDCVETRLLCVRIILNPSNSVNEQ